MVIQFVISGFLKQTMRNVMFRHVVEHVEVSHWQSYHIVILFVNTVLLNVTFAK